MSKLSDQFLCLPGEDAQEIWERSENGTWERVTDSTRKGCVLALECITLDSSPFWARSAVGSTLNAHGVASLHWEALGLEDSTEGTSWTHWQVAQEDGKTLLGTAALCRDAPQVAWLVKQPASCLLAAQLYPIPASHAAVWKELGRYVVAFTRGEALLHFSVLSARELDGDAAREINELAQALEIREMLPKLKGVRLWCDGSKEFLKQLEKALGGVRVRTEDKPAPRLPAEHCEINPPEIARARREEIKRKRMRRAVILGAVFYLFAFALWSGMLFLRAGKLGKLETHLQQQEPELTVVREAQLRWLALEPATDPDQYPLEVFHRIGSLLPPEGIRLEEFVFDTVDSKKIVVRGQASSSRDALKFQADIKNSELLKRYPWEVPVPAIRPDNQATFRAEALLAKAQSTTP